MGSNPSQPALLDHGDRWIRVAAALSVLTVAGIALVISYRHAYALVVAHGETGATARALPFTIDGLILTCSLVLLDSARRDQRAPALAWFLLACGITATLAANVAHGLNHGVVGAVIAGWPALVAVGSFEMLARLIRGGRADLATGALGVPGVFQTAVPDHPASGAERNTQTAPWWPLPDFGDAGEPVDGYSVWERIEPTREPIASMLTAGTDGGADLVSDVHKVADQDPVIATARERFATVLASGALPSVRAVRREMRVGHPRAQQIREALAESAS